MGRLIYVILNVRIRATAYTTYLHPKLVISTVCVRTRVYHIIIYSNNASCAPPSPPTCFVLFFVVAGFGINARVIVSNLVRSCRGTRVVDRTFMTRVYTLQDITYSVIRTTRYCSARSLDGRQTVS